MELRSKSVSDSHTSVRLSQPSRRLNPPTASPKPHPSLIPATESLSRPSKRARLTDRNLKHHTRQINQAMPPKNSSSGGSSSRSRSSNTKSEKSRASSSSNISTRDPEFSEKLSKRNVIHGHPGAGKLQKPNDFTTMREILDKERSSQPPDEDVFDEYNDRLTECHVEEEVREVAWQFLAKPPAPGVYQRVNRAWCRVNNDITDGFSDPKPDKSLSLKLDTYPAAAVEALQGVLRPSAGPMAMPSYCMECKPESGDLQNGIAQAAYDGAVMVDASRKVHDYLGQPEAKFYRSTQAITVAFNGSSSTIFANHAVKNKQVEYHQVPLSVTNPTISLEDFRRARKEIRNAEEWAIAHERRKRDELVAYEEARATALEELAVEEKARQDAQLITGPLSPPVSSTGNATAPPPTETRRKGAPSRGRAAENQVLAVNNSLREQPKPNATTSSRKPVSTAKITTARPNTNALLVDSARRCSVRLAAGRTEILHE